jgi:hypothetical protein
VADIKDITAQKGSYSKTIVLPNSKETQKVLGQLFEINIGINDASFNVNRKVPAVLLQDEVPVLEGYFQLKAINKRSPSDVSFDEIVTYEGLIFQDTTSFFEIIDKKDLTALSFSGYNHVFAFSAVTASSGYTWTDGYVYPWHWTPKSYYDLSEFRPAFFVKTIWDKIFADAGFSYVSDFLNSDPFTKLIIPFTGKNLEISDLEKESREFRVSVSSANTISYSANSTIYTPLLSIAWVPVYPFNDETTGINFDGSKNNFNISNSNWDVKATGTYLLDTRLSGTVTFTPDITFFGQNNAARIVAKMHIIVNGVEPYPPIVSPSFSLGPIIVTGGTAYTYGWFVGADDVALELNIGDTVTFLVEVNYESLVIGGGYPTTHTGNFRADFNTAYSETDNFVNVTAQKTGLNVAPGDVMDMDDLVPGKIKQRDFVKSFVDMFNLYIQVDSNNVNRLIINTREEFFAQSANTYVDWSDKMDYTQEYKVQLLSELQEKTLDFTWKEDKDYLNQNYRENTGFLYGEYKINFDNDFTRGTKVISPIFTSTPLARTLAPISATTGNGMITPYLTPGVDQNIRVLYYGGPLPTDTYNMSYVNLNGTTGLTPLNFYNYAGHFDNPLDPDFDLNWNVNEFYYYNAVNSGVTDNNLYNKYWKSYVNLIAESKVLTAYFNLSEYDINDLSFQRKIWIRDSYWYPTKITDYSAVRPQLTKVELIKAVDAPKFTKKKIGKPNYWTDLQTLEIPLGGLAYLNDNLVSNNHNHGSFGSVIGIGNNIGYLAQGVEIVGDDNNVGQGTVRMRIGGNQNQAGPNGSQLFINGSSNRIGAFSNNIHINGDNNFVQDSSNAVIIDGGYNNIISGGSNFISITNSNNNNLHNSVSAVSIFNSTNVIVQSGVYNASVFNSSGITIASGVTNVTVTNLNNLVITGSNQSYGGTSGGTSGTDIYITGATFSAGTLNLNNSTGGTITAVGNIPWENIQTGQTVGFSSIPLSQTFVGTGVGVYNVKGFVSGINSTNDLVYAAELYSVVKSSGSTLEFVAKGLSTVTSEFPINSVGANILININPGVIYISCLGTSGQTINWKTNLKIY